MFRVGTVPWLNAVPLAAGLSDEVELEAATPADLARHLAEGSLDAALLPSAEAARGVGDGPLGRHGIASEGPVASVLVFLRRPPQEVRTVALDRASRTSAALARHLLDASLPGPLAYRPASRAGPDPRSEEADAVLVIGDPALAAAAAWPGQVLDLGAEWTRRTGLPFVFARWTARAGLTSEERARLADVLDRAADRGLPRRADLAREWAQGHGQDPHKAIHYVQRHVRYRIGPREEEALARFADVVRAQDAADRAAARPV